jgi:broad specificity phosphatase PhoE
MHGMSRRRGGSALALFILNANRASSSIAPHATIGTAAFHMNAIKSPPFNRAFLSTRSFCRSHHLCHLPSAVQSRFYGPLSISIRSHGTVFGSSSDTDYEYLKQSRPIRIRAEAISPQNNNNQQQQREDIDESYKIVHFQRHGQGTHNEIYRVWTETHGKPLDLSETNPQKNPLLLPNVIDAPLTEKGRNQCLEQRPLASDLLGVELVIVSPLVRALQTAHITFVDHLPTTTAANDDDGSGGASSAPQRKNAKWVAHEGIREELGLLLCNQRRPLSETKLEFPHVDFSHLSHHGEEDVVWNNHCQQRQTFNTDENRMGNASQQRETTVDMSHRCYVFLVDFLKNRTEREVAVVGHSAWLHAMCNAVLDCGGDETLLPMFGQAELRSTKLTFSER